MNKVVSNGNKSERAKRYFIFLFRNSLSSFNLQKNQQIKNHHVLRSNWISVHLLQPSWKLSRDKYPKDPNSYSTERYPPILSHHGPPHSFHHSLPSLSSILYGRLHRNPQQRRRSSDPTSRFGRRRSSSQRGAPLLELQAEVWEELRYS